MIALNSNVCLPHWLEELCQAEIVSAVQAHPGTRHNLRLGLPFDEARKYAIGEGRADFDSPYKQLSPNDRCLLYAFVNQRGHLEELHEAFCQIFRNGRPQSELVVLASGCGPFTGGLALLAALPGVRFTYIGLDRSSAMRKLGQDLARAAQAKVSHCGNPQWVANFNEICWTQLPSWRPVLIIVSYLLASTTLNVRDLADQINVFCALVGRGPVTILYTNSIAFLANRGFDDLRSALETAGFVLKVDEEDSITITRSTRSRERRLRYALFHTSHNKTSLMFKAII